MNSDKVIDILPNKDWILTNDEYIKFPIIKYYRQLRNLDLPFHFNGNISKLYNDGTLTIGASWNNLIHTSHYMARCYIFEKLYMPYKIDSEHIKIRNGVLLWPKINLYAYTYLPDPRRVFILKNNKFVIEFKFNDDCIIIREQITLDLIEKIKLKTVTLRDISDRF